MSILNSSQLSFLPYVEGNEKPYFLLLKPGEPFFSFLKELKIESDHFLGVNHHSMSYPHVTLLQFLMNEKQEPGFIELINEFIPAFKDNGLKILGLGEFPNINTIIVELGNQSGLLAAINRVTHEMFFRRLLNTRTRLHKSRNFHVTIAKEVEETQFDALKAKLSRHSFDGYDFNPSQLLLFRKKSLTDKNWEKVSEFGFAGINS